MDLLIDIGNTRIKWATFDGHHLSQQEAASYANWTCEELTDQILSKLHKPERVLVANVAGAQVGALVAKAIRQFLGIDTIFIHSSKAAAGLRNAYSDPEKLGVDRWLAAIGGYHLERRAICVVSVGTAMTIDGVDASGQHLGGIIVPGPDLMLTSLYRNTSDIAERARDGTPGTGIFANNTQAAVTQGVVHSLAAVTERAYHDMLDRVGESPALIITGGASDRIASALRIPFRVVPDLVLRGLSEIAREQSS